MAVSESSDATEDLVNLLRSLARLFVSSRGVQDHHAGCRSIEHSGSSSLECVLAVGLELIRAERVGWRSPGSAPIVLERRVPATRRAIANARVAHEQDWSRVNQLEAGRIVRVSEGALKRSARCAHRGTIKEWIGCRPLIPRGGLAVLWLECAEVGTARNSDVAALASALIHLSEVTECLQPDREGARLDALARNAGAWIHDMRHVFQIIGLKAELLGELPTELPVGRGVDDLMTSVREASTLCERALHVGGRSSSYDSVVLRSLLVREASAAASISGRPDRVRVSIDCHDDLTVRTDVASIARVVRNLVLNAIEASPDGGDVEIRARARGRAEYELSVSDRGRGMSKGDLQRLLRCGQSGGSGTGFGTSSIAECVSALRGRMEFESRLGIGTLARIVLPNATESDGSRRVIVICGDRRRRLSIARSFELFGWQAIEAVDGEDALEGLARFGPADVALIRGTPGEGLDAVGETALGFDRRLAVLSIAEGGVERSVERAIQCFQSTSSPLNTPAACV